MWTAGSFRQAHRILPTTNLMRPDRLLRSSGAEAAECTESAEHRGESILFFLYFLLSGVTPKRLAARVPRYSASFRAFRGPLGVVRRAELCSVRHQHDSVTRDLFICLDDSSETRRA